MSNSERNPVSPPTVSGWYVISWSETWHEVIEWLAEQDVANRVGWGGVMSIEWDEVVSWSGPLDLKAMLEKGGKE